MKRNTNLRNLSSDHHNALALARKINRETKDDNNITALTIYVREVFDTELSKHFDIEEKTILPKLRKSGEYLLVEKTLNDHARLRQLIDVLDQPGKLVEFAETLKQHVRFEEMELFEACQNKLDDRALEAIGQACIRQLPSY